MTIGSSGTFPISVRLPGELRQKIEDLRTEERRSMNAQIITLLEEALANRAGDATEAAPPRGRQPRRQESSRTRHSPCPHRTPKGAYCKRCQRVID